MSDASQAIGTAAVGRSLVRGVARATATEGTNAKPAMQFNEPDVVRDLEQSLSRGIDVAPNSARTEVASTRSTPIGSKIGPWEDEATGLRRGDVFMQCADGSCVSATGQVMTNGAVTERQLLDRLGEWSNPEALAGELNRAIPNSRFVGGYFATAADALAIAARGRFGAVLQARGAPGHMVTIEPIAQGRSFHVLDTGIGASYKVQPSWIEKYVSGGVWKEMP